MKPGPCIGPVAVGSGHGYAQYLRRLGDGETGKVTQLDKLGLDGVFCRELDERFVKRQKFFAQLGRGQLHIVDMVTNEAAAALVAQLAASAFYQNAAHGLRSRGKEVAPAVPALCLSPANDSHVCLVNQRRRL